MSVFTPVSQDQLSAWLKHYSVGTLHSVTGIEEGAENSNFLVTTSHGCFVLTLFERLGRNELPFFLHLMAHLDRHGIPCPAPVANRDNEILGTLNGKPALLATFLPGASQMAPGLEHCAAVGDMLANLHLAGQSFNRKQDNPRGPRWWRETAPKVMPFLDEAGQTLLRDEIRYQLVLHAEQHEDLPKGVIHADLFRDNVLFDGSRITGIVDFYFAGQDCWLFDVAVTVNAWCSTDTGALDEARTRALLRAYHSVRPFSQVEHGAWPVMLRAAALRFWLSRLLDSHVPRYGELVRVRDPGQYQAILSQRVALGSAAPWVG